jgi:hypothetical protein
VGGLDEPLGQPVVEGGVDLGAVLYDASLQLDGRGMRQRRAHEIQRSIGVLAGLDLELECDAQTFLSRMSARCSRG